MKSASEILLEKSVADVFKKHRWLKQGRTWRREGEFITSFYNLQKSNWGGDLFYENVGFSIRELSQGRHSSSPGKWDCTTRVDHIVPSKEIVGTYVDFDRCDDPKQEVENCVSVIRTYVIPYFRDLDSEESICRFYGSMEARKFRISPTTREWMRALVKNRST